MPIVTETGKTNAFRFVQTVNDLSKSSRVVVIYSKTKHSSWPWMRNPAWQTFVLAQLAHKASVRDAQFHPGDNVDELCFSAISIAGESSVEHLTLDETIEGRTPPKGFFRRMAWIFAAIVGGLS